jgi:CheY-like chemotaxis protein
MEAVAETSAMMLAALGYSVVVAVNGLDALKKMESAASPFDAIITDVLMPEMDGLEFLQALNKQEKEGAAPQNVLVTSGGGTRVPLDLCKELATPYQKHFISKPYTLEELQAGLKTLFDGS